MEELFLDNSESVDISEDEERYAKIKLTNMDTINEIDED
jgi:hypothetical protein